MSHFFAFLARMKFIQRWGLMRNTQSENIQEHSLQVAMIAHSLAEIRNSVFGGSVDAGKTAVLGMYHEVSEVFTGDLPTPVKYFNPQIKAVYKDIERQAQKKLLLMLPEELQASYTGIIQQDEENELWQLVKAADKLSAYLKCVEEIKVGNQEFNVAYTQIQQELLQSPLPEVRYFLDAFADSFGLTLDELKD